MSTNQSCHIVKIQTGEWYYILEHPTAPKNAWDWREYASACGPFASADQAYQHMTNNHANPGGYMQHENADTTGDPVLQKLIAEATSPRRSVNVKVRRFPWS